MREHHKNLLVGRAQKVFQERTKSPVEKEDTVLMLESLSGFFEILANVHRRTKENKNISAVNEDSYE